MSDSLVVIGSNSFSGASFVRYCLCKGMQVIGMSRSPEPHDVFLPYRWGAGGDGDPQKGEFKFYQLDLNNDTDAIAEIIQRNKSSWVVNFAAQSMVAQSWQQPADWYRTNILSNVRLYEKLRLFSFLQKYVHVSTPEVYGNTEGVVTESACFSPSTPYAVSRAACDMHLLACFKQYGFPVVFTRAANVYGPGQQLYRIIPRVMYSARTGRKLSLHGGGVSVRAFIHIRDVAEATWRVMEKGRPGETYHVSTDEFISIRELVEKICGQMGVKFSDVVEVAGERPGKDLAYKLDTRKIAAELDWKPTIPLKTGLAETLSWFDKSLPDLLNQNIDYVHKP